MSLSLRNLRGVNCGIRFLFFARVFFEERKTLRSFCLGFIFLWQKKQLKIILSLSYAEDSFAVSVSRRALIGCSRATRSRAYVIYQRGEDASFFFCDGAERDFIFYGRRKARKTKAKRKHDGRYLF